MSISIPFARPCSCHCGQDHFPRKGFRPEAKGFPMDKIQKEALQVTKEITVKFIELQRVSPSNFADVFPAVYKVVRDVLKNDAGAEHEHE
jgi:hypothetical protein